MTMDEELLTRAREIASRYGGEHLTPAAGEGDILLFGPNSVLLARREGDAYYVSHLVGPPREWLARVYDLAKALKERGEQRVVVRSPAGSPVTQFVVRRHPERFTRAGDYYESTAERWP